MQKNVNLLQFGHVEELEVELSLIDSQLKLPRTRKFLANCFVGAHSHWSATSQLDMTLVNESCEEFGDFVYEEHWNLCELFHKVLNKLCYLPKCDKIWVRVENSRMYEICGDCPGIAQFDTSKFRFLKSPKSL